MFHFSTWLEMISHAILCTVTIDTAWINIKFTKYILKQKLGSEVGLETLKIDFESETLSLWPHTMSSQNSDKKFWMGINLILCADFHET